MLNPCEILSECIKYIFSENVRTNATIFSAYNDYKVEVFISDTNYKVVFKFLKHNCELKLEKVLIYNKKELIKEFKDCELQEVFDYIKAKISEVISEKL